MDDAQRFGKERYKHWLEDQVRFSDLDPLGHVNNNAVGQYFENARAALFMELTPEWPNREQIFVLARIAIDFRQELHYPTPICVGTGVISLGRTSMTLANALFRANDGIAYCDSVSVLIDRKSRKPVALPEDLRKVILKYA